MRGRTVAGIFASAVFLAGTSNAQAPAVGLPGLPAPTGPFAVGRVTLVCEDASRIEPLDPSLNARRIMVDVWYPAEPGGSRELASAEYLNVREIEGAIGTDGLKKQLGASYDVVKAGGVVTHALVGAPFSAALRRSPVLIFSPGGGMIRELYTSQLEDLASHGYVVAALTHTYDGFVTVFPDGSHVAYDGKRWPQTPSLEGEANLNQLEWHADDIRAVLDELSRAPSSLPFAGRLDLARIGTFGHSFGGLAAAHACQKDPRFKACLNQDGAVANQPYLLDASGWGMNQAFMLIERAPRTEPPTDQELAAMKLTRARMTELRKRLDSRRDRELRATGKGTVRVALQRAETSHMDFSDLQILGASDRTEREMRERVLSIVKRYTRAFFDLHLKGLRSPLLDAEKRDQLVDAVQTYGPTQRGK